MRHKKTTFIIKFASIILMFYLSFIDVVAQQLYPASFEVTTLNGTNGFTIPGVQVDLQFGAETKFIGDINNDGLEDIAVGVGNTTQNGFSGAGAAYIIFGSNTGFSTSFDISTLNGTNGFVFEGIVEGEAIGLSIGGVGDINGDSIDDLVIGASRVGEGIIVLYGKSNGTAFNATMNRNDINGSNGFIISTIGVSEQINDIGSLGDVNGDGHNDFILGSGIGGSARIFFGRSTNFPASIDLSWLDGINGFRTSSFPGSRPAYKVGGAGDINNDGYDDILIGNWDSSDPAVSYLLFGKGTPYNALVDLPSLNGTDGFSIDNNGGGFLTFVGPLGDINNDGIDDFFSENDIIFGSTTPFPSSITMSSLDGSNGFVLQDYVLCATPTGDLNFDGIDDFLVAAADDYVVYGTNTGFPSAFDPSTLNGTNGFQIPNINNSNIGRPVDGGKDFNGDGISDFIIGSPSASSTGEVYMIFGGDHYAMPLNTGYPQATNETETGFTLLMNGPETGTIHYAIYPGNYTSTVGHNDILNGTGAVSSGNFAMNPENTDISEVITSLTAGTAYDVYLFLEDALTNQGEIYQLNDVTTVASCPPYIIPCEERDALIALYNATDGANWTNNTNWLTTNPIDSWFGVTVTEGHVTGIDFGASGNNLNGTLPIELGDLNFLEKFIIVSSSNLTGSIVPELFTNTSLTTIDLSNCGLTGSIPSNISNLIALQSLELDYNTLSGTIPAGMYTLTNLGILNLYRNNISGPISTDIQNLTQLTTLSLGRNPIGSTIPIEIANLTNLTNLNIYNANLTGTIPTEIGNLINLEYLDLSRNQLSGSIPASLGNLTQLISLYLGTNNLSGLIPPSLGNLTNVRLFLLGTNQLTGAIPPELGMLTNVTSFYLYNNNLSGTIPPELGGLTSVEQLYLSNNQLEGVIPASLATLPNVNDIFFFNNNLSGAFPDFTQALNLNYRILLEDNAFQFGDFENQWNTYQTQLDTFKDAPQANVNLEETITVNEGDNITLTTTVSGSQNNYQWYKNNIIITGETASDLILNPTQLTDAGDYYCLITSNIVTDLTLRRNPIHLIVNPLPDTEVPAITCLANQIVSCTETTVPDYTTLVTVTDNVDPNPVITQNPAAGTAFTNGMTIIMTATDASGNTNTCQFIVNTAADTESPVLTCPANQELSFETTIIPDYTSLATVTDNCNTNLSISQSPVAGTSFTNGMTIQLTTTDASGNSINCTFQINAVDTQAPAITCPANQIVSCTETTVPDYTTLVTVTDNVDPNPVITQNPAAGTAFTNGMTIIMTATDASNNKSECMFSLNSQTESVDAGEDEYIIEGEEIQLTAIATTIGTFTWTPSVGLSNNNVANPIANPTETTTYNLTFISEEGCIAEDTITVFVESLPEKETKYGFSPDGDGINEFWEIYEIENYPDNEVSIFNRWGNLVFQIKGYNNVSRAFTGIANKNKNLGGDKLPEGTYFFNIKINSSHNLKKLTGYLVLKR